MIPFSRLANADAIFGSAFACRHLHLGSHGYWWSLRRQSQALAQGVRVDIEDRTDALEGVWPVCLPGEQPLPYLVEEPSASSVCGEAILVYALDRVVEDGDPEPVLRCQFSVRSEVLRRHNHAWLEQVTRNSRQIAIRVHSHASFVQKARQCRKLGVLRAWFYARGLTRSRRRQARTGSGARSHQCCDLRRIFGGQ